MAKGYVKEDLPRVAMAQGKQGIWLFNFSRQGKHREFSKFKFLHRENCANTGKILKIKNFLKILLLKWQQGDGAFLS